MTDKPNRRKSGGRIADYLPLIQAADGLTLSQVCALSDLEPSTIQNWIKRGYVPHPVGKKYLERHLARVLLIAQLRESMQLDRIGMLLAYINGDTDDESDDMITEQALYDLFCVIMQQLEDRPAAPDAIRQTVRECCLRNIGEAPDKLLTALEIMAHTHMANLFKYEADRLFQESID